MNATTGQKQAVRAYNQVVREGRYRPVKWTCLCGSREVDRVCEYDRHGLWAPIGLCRKCGFIYATPRLPQEAYEAFYISEAYRLIYEDGADVIGAAERKFEAGVNRHIFETLAPCLAHVPHPSVLEFGCGGGWNLVHFHRAGHQVRGYDYSGELTAFGRDRGLDLSAGSFTDITGQYDGIVLCHVLEHFFDLFQDLRLILDHLKDDGTLYVEVPNMDNFNASQPQNVHLSYFSPRTLVHYLGQAGLRLLALDTTTSMHMHALFQKADSPTASVGLDSEYKTMRGRILRGKVKSFFGSLRRSFLG